MGGLLAVPSELQLRVCVHLSATSDTEPRETSCSEQESRAPLHLQFFNIQCH